MPVFRDFLLAIHHKVWHNVVRNKSYDREFGLCHTFDSSRKGTAKSMHPSRNGNKISQQYLGNLGRVVD
jgi:hypothetical protein